MASLISIVELWEKANVWILPVKSGLQWIAGVVMKLEVAESDSEWKFSVRSLDGTDHVISTISVDSSNTEFEFLKRRDDSSLKGNQVDDMTSLIFLNEPEMVNCIQNRFKSKLMYTGIGPILVAVNPFERLPIYGEKIADDYFEASTLAESKALGPHVYYLSDSAYRRMFINKYDPDQREDQVILVNGESGSGKTESTKLVLQYLARVSSKVLLELDDQVACNRDFERLIAASNPITESFGNAKTSRNNNSSRFGKIIDLLYSGDGFIEGASVCTYLLETVRVAFQQKGERNYHVFYEMFAGLDSALKQDWGLVSLEAFRYTNQSGESRRHDGETDQDNFTRLNQAMSDIGLDNVDRETVFRVVAGILHLGNISFDESTESGSDAAVFSATSSNHLEQVCRLLGFSETNMLVAMSKRSFVVAGCEIHKAINMESAVSARDAMAKTIYELLFKWMVNTINITLHSGSFEHASTIAVLDIFGFEYFTKNSFEQLCINYANEKLQDHFNFATFKSQQEMYLEEGLVWTVTEYPDNSERLELFEHKTNGLFALCDEQLKMAKPTDEKLVNVLYVRCADRVHFSASKRDQTHRAFTVHHFACNVTYSIDGFLEKNKSEVAVEINMCISNCSNPVLHAAMLISSDDTVPPIPSASVKRRSSTNSMTLQRKSSGSRRQSVGKKSHTVASQFAKQLTGLVQKIRLSRSHFIRCVKPNMQLQPTLFDYEMVLAQLRCGGALDAIQVFRAGFPNRMDFSYFVTRYSTFLCICGLNAITRDMFNCMQRAQHTGSDLYWRISASRLIDIVKLTASVLNEIENSQLPDDVDMLSGLQLGKTGVFLRATVYEYLERLHHASVSFVAKRVQRRWRAHKMATSSSTSGKAQEYHAINALLYFADHKKRHARAAVSATVLLQRRARVLFAVLYKRRVVKGITLLKARFRGYKGRQFVHNMKVAAATSIQSRFRSFCETKKYQTKRNAIRDLQRISRGKLSRLLKARMLRSVGIMQKTWRGHAGRVIAEAIREVVRQAILEEERKREEAKSAVMKQLEARLQENPNLLDDIDNVTATLRNMKEELTVVTNDLKAASKSREALQEKLNQKEEEAQRLQFEVRGLIGIQQDAAIASFVVNNLNEALKNELSISLRLLSDPSTVSGSSVLENGDIDSKVYENEILPTLESIRENLVANRALTAEVTACIQKQNTETASLREKLEQMEASYRALTAENSHLQGTLDKIRSQSSDDLLAAQKENQTLSDRSSVLEHQMQSLQMALTNEQEANELLRYQVKQLDEQLSDLMSEHQQLKDSAETSRTELTSRSTQLTEQLQRLQEDIHTVEATNRTLTTEKSDLETTLHRLQRESSEESTTAQQVIKKLSSEISDLQRKLEEATCVASDLEESGRKWNEDLTAAQMEIASLLLVKEEHGKLTAQTKIDEKALRSLEEKCDGLESALATKEAKELELSLSLTALNAHASSLEDSNLKFSAELSKVREELKLSQTHCTAVEKKAEELSTNIAVTRQKFATEVETLKLAKTQAYAEKQVIVDQMEQLKGRLDESNNKVESFVAELSQARNQIHNYDRTNRALRQDLERTEADHRDIVRSLQIEVEEGRAREEALESRVEHLTAKLEEGLYRAMEKKYSRLLIEYESLKNKYEDLQGHFTHEVCLSDLVKNVEACRGDVTRRRDRWKLPLTTTVEKWIRFSEQEVVFVISVHLKDTTSTAFNTMATSEAYAEYQSLLDANSSVIRSEFPAVFFTAYSPFENYLETRASALGGKLTQINSQLATIPATDRMAEISRFSREVSEFCGLGRK